MPSTDLPETRPLTAAEREKCAKELFEDPKQIKSQIEALREWIQQQPHLTCRTDDEFLIRFLRVGKYSQARARKQIDHYVTVRSSPDTREWYNQTGEWSDLDKKILDMGLQLILPNQDSEGRSVIIIRTGAYDPKEFHINDIFRIGNTLGEIYLRHAEHVQVHGVIALLDFTHFGMSHASYFSPGMMKKAASTWQDCIPFRQKALNYYNTPSVFNALFEVLKYFLKEKTKKRINFHKSSIDSLHSKIPKDVLPEEYGGTCGTLQDVIEFNKKLAYRYVDEMKKNSNMSVDESKRPVEKQGDSDSWGGVTGSFRKLAVD